MKDRGIYDFDDMIIWVLKAFNENEELLRRKCLGLYNFNVALYLTQ